jgi:hypothetical protein
MYVAEMDYYNLHVSSLKMIKITNSAVNEVRLSEGKLFNRLQDGTWPDCLLGQHVDR